MQVFTSSLAKAITPVEVTEAIVDMGTVACSARTGMLWLLSPDRTRVCLARSVGALTFRDEDHELAVDRPARTPILDAIGNAAPVWIESRGQLERVYPASASPGGEMSSASIPLFAQGHCIGVLAFEFDGAHAFFEDERAFFQVLSWYAAQAVERTRLYAAEQRARHAAERNQRRSDFLADVGSLLASSLDYASTLAGIANAAVPRVADWCIVELEQERQRGAPAVVAHADPEKVSFVLELSERFGRLRLEVGIPSVIRTGKSELYRSITPAQLAAALPSNPYLADLFTKTGLVSSMVVPISARGRVLGAIVLNSADPSRLYDEQDLAMAEELGRRAGLAVDNARLYREAREADRLKDEFLAMLSHELRNPLTPIVTALDLMEIRAGETCAHERGIISRQVQHMVRLVDDLLNVARVTRGKIRLDKEHYEVAHVIAKAVEMVKPSIDDRGQTLTVDVPPIGIPIHGDLERLAQAVANLLTNASKYGELGGVVSVVARAEDFDAVIRVRDTGIGIAAETLPTIFELFVQETRALDRAQGGLGIGLTVVQRLIELHEGRVSAHSAGLGHGSEFVIRLPLTPGVPIVAPRVRRPQRDLSMPPGRALVVDDNTDAAELLCEALDELGYATRVAHDGESALLVATDFAPDLALLDVGLPKMDGYELARQLRGRARGTEMRLVAVTGYGQESDYLRSREAGFDEHIVKPIDLDTLRGILDRARSGT